MATTTTHDRDASSLLDELATLADDLARAEQRLHDHVLLLRDRRVTWTEIGSALHVSRQAAWQRFELRGRERRS